MVVAASPPLAGVHAEPVDEHEDAAVRMGNGHVDRAGVDRQRHAVVVQAHAGGERVGGGGEVVAEHPVEHGQHRVALGRRARSGRGQHGRDLAEQGVEGAAHEVRDPADASIDEAGDPPYRTMRRRRADEAGRLQDVVVQVLDHARQREGRVDGQPACGVQVSDVHVAAARRGAMRHPDHHARPAWWVPSRPAVACRLWPVACGRMSHQGQFARDDSRRSAYAPSAMARPARSRVRRCSLSSSALAFIQQSLRARS